MSEREPTVEAMALAAHIRATMANPRKSSRECALDIDALAASRVAERDAEIAELEAGAELALTYHGRLERADAEITALRAQLEWRPIGTARGTDPVLVVDAYGDQWIAYQALGDEGMEWRSNGEGVPTSPIAWRAHYPPLPATPAPVRKETHHHDDASRKRPPTQGHR